MSDTQKVPDLLQEHPGLESTADDGEHGPEVQAGASPSSPSDETGDFTAGPPTEADTRGGVAGRGADAAETAGPGETFHVPADDRTTPPEPGEMTDAASAQPVRNGAATLDVDATTAPDGNRTADFMLAPGLHFGVADTERMIPPPGGPRDEELPRITGYEILSVLGVGGMGIVYKARQPRLDRFVALKMIRAGAGAHAGDLRRFEAEARAVAAIDHPNIIKIFEIGERGGLPYFSLEYIEGGSLARRIDGKPQPVDECGADHRNARPRPRRDPPPRHHPPRHQAGQHPAVSSTARPRSPTSAW